MRGSVEDLISHQKNVVEYLNSLLTTMVSVINSGAQGVGVDIPSATTITPSAAIHHVTGTTTIATINVVLGFSGPLYLIPEGAWHTNTAGNIALASTAVLHKVLILVYDNVVGAWYPSY